MKSSTETEFLRPGLIPLGIIAFVGLILLIVMACGGCDDAIVETYGVKETVNDTMIITLERYADFNIVYDSDTKVMYTMSNYGTHGIFTVLLNADGTPKLYTGE